MGTSSPSPHLSSASVGASLLPPALRTPPLAGMRSSARSVASLGVPTCFGNGLQLERLETMVLGTPDLINVEYGSQLPPMWLERAVVAALSSEASLEAASSGLLGES
ncbi:hypothetical protein HU200_040755 [Digitaria exilis]|uniref:Uncharacterized protein n=1 Tax=Digitaria exilis TaxID=1010633 RepID=A0A835B7C7_9POAL|nr:hypothetical protein HU200_040755 [Digitaria exilis]